VELALNLNQYLTKDAPFSPALQGVIIEAVNGIVRSKPIAGRSRELTALNLLPPRSRTKTS
jgi:hypothetical protein